MDGVWVVLAFGIEDREAWRGSHPCDYRSILSSVYILLSIHLITFTTLNLSYFIVFHDYSFTVHQHPLERSLRPYCIAGIALSLQEQKHQPQNV